MKIESKIGRSAHSDRQIFAFITDFNNFRDLIPGETVSGWESSEDRCSFHVDPVGKTGMMIVDKEPHSLVKIVSVPDISAYQFTIWIQLKPAGEQGTHMKITIEPRVSKLILPVIKSPLKQFVNGLIEKMESFDFPEAP